MSQWFPTVAILSLPASATGSPAEALKLATFILYPSTTTSTAASCWVTGCIKLTTKQYLPHPTSTTISTKPLLLRCHHWNIIQRHHSIPNQSQHHFKLVATTASHPPHVFRFFFLFITCLILLLILIISVSSNLLRRPQQHHPPWRVFPFFKLVLWYISDHFDIHYSTTAPAYVHQWRRIFPGFFFTNHLWWLITSNLLVLTTTSTNSTTVTTTYLRVLFLFLLVFYFIAMMIILIHMNTFKNCTQAGTE